MAGFEVITIGRFCGDNRGGAEIAPLVLAVVVVKKQAIMSAKMELLFTLEGNQFPFPNGVRIRVTKWTGLGNAELSIGNGMTK